MARSKVLMSALLLAVMLLSTFCAVGSPLRLTDSVPMPKGLENVHLGMTVDELKKARPSLQADDFPNSRVYVETALSNEFFSYVSYEFEAGKLTKVTLSQSSDSAGIRSRCPGLFKGGIKKWGTNFSRLEGVIENHPATQETYSYPVLYWEKPEANIVVRCVLSSDKRNAPNFYSLTIFSAGLSLNQAVKMRIKNSVAPDELNKLFKGILVDDVKEPLFR